VVKRSAENSHVLHWVQKVRYIINTIRQWKHRRLSHILRHDIILIATCMSTVECKSKKSPWCFLTFSPNGWEFLAEILHAYYTFLSTLYYNFFIQLFATLTKLLCHIKCGHPVHIIICSKCPPSIETHFGWSHLIWYNFIIVGDNWIKICSLA